MNTLAAALPVTAPSVDSSDTLNTLESVGLNANGLNHFKAYDSQLAIPETEGTRIVKCLYQENKKTGKKAGENSYIRLPVSHITPEIIASRLDELTPYIMGFLFDKEDLIVKEAHKKGQLNFESSALSLDKIIEKLEESELSGRLNKEMISAWFNEVISDDLAAQFAEKLGLHADSSDADISKLGKVIAAYKGKFESLASPKISLIDADCLALISVIKKVDSKQSLIGLKFIKKLEATMAKVEEDLLML